MLDVISHCIFAWRFDTCKLNTTGLVVVSRGCFEFLLQSKQIVENLQCAALIRRIDQDILACFVRSLALGVVGWWFDSCQQAAVSIWLYLSKAMPKIVTTISKESMRRLKQWGVVHLMTSKIS